MVVIARFYCRVISNIYIPDGMSIPKIYCRVMML